MTSKLARQMEYKKRLEEEHRAFQERCRVRICSNYIIVFIVFVISMKESQKSKVIWESRSIGVTVERR